MDLSDVFDTWINVKWLIEIEVGEMKRDGWWATTCKEEQGTMMEDGPKICRSDRDYLVGD